MQGSAQCREYGVGALRAMAHNEANKTAIAHSGGLTAFLSMARDGSEKAKAQALDALVDLASDESNEIAVVGAGAINPLVALLQKGSDYCRMQAAKTLRLLSDESEAVQLAIANAGGVSALLELSKSGSEQTQEQAAGVLVNLACSDTNGNKPKMVECGAIMGLLNLAKKSDSREAQEYAVRALRHLIAKNTDYQAQVIDAGGFLSFVGLLSTSSMETREQAVGILLDFVWASSSNKQKIVDAGALDPLLSLSQEAPPAVMQQAAAVLRNLAVGYEDTIGKTITEKGGASVMKKSKRSRTGSLSFQPM
mmetsp:Transcript_23579/g.69227  ORF Transcript_23579/g.69227 Transcript_23579/m.69227 type:complete len:308 (+) Transcript_23579:767-1690(+)